MEYYTVKQLAEEFNVSRQAIHKQLNKVKYQPFISKKKVDNYLSTVVNQEGYHLLANHFNINNSKVDNVVVNVDQKADNCLQNDNKKHCNNGINMVDNQGDNVDSDNITKLLAAKDETITALKEELATVHKELSKLSDVLEHEQELHLMDQKKAQQLENQIKQLTQSNEATTNTNIIDNQSTTQPSQNKKWWQFWK